MSLWTNIKSGPTTGGRSTHVGKLPVLDMRTFEEQEVTLEKHNE